MKYLHLKRLYPKRTKQLKAINLILLLLIVFSKEAYSQEITPSYIMKAAQSTCEEANDIFTSFGYKFHSTQKINGTTAFVWSQGRTTNTNLVNNVMTKTCNPDDDGAMMLNFEFLSTSYYHKFKKFLLEKGFTLDNTQSFNNQMWYDYSIKGLHISVSLISGFDSKGINTYTILITNYK